MFDFYGQTNAIMNNQQALNAYFTNMQNQFTPGYKSESISFTDVMGSAMVHGAKHKSGGIVFSQGAIQQDKNPTHLAINGGGFFVLDDGTGSTHYTRDGRFSFQNGTLASESGMKVQGYRVNEDGSLQTGEKGTIEFEMDPSTKKYKAKGDAAGKYNGFHFDSTGTLYGEMSEEDPMTNQKVTKSIPLYKVSMATFANNSGLKKTGTTTFGMTEDSGKPVEGVSGEGALGNVAPESLEMASVDFAQQALLIGMAKQNYEANFSAFRAMDKLTQPAIGLIR